jgi:hypothetical protein
MRSEYVQAAINILDEEIGRVSKDDKLISLKTKKRNTNEQHSIHWSGISFCWIHGGLPKQGKENLPRKQGGGSSR